MNDFINFLGKFFTSIYVGLAIVAPVVAVDAWLNTQRLEKRIDEEIARVESDSEDE